MYTAITNMRVLVLLVTVGLAVSQILPTNENAYTRDYEYIYTYETQVLSGVPHHGIQVSGVRIRCDVRMQFKTMTRALMQIENIEVFSILNELAEPYSSDGLVPETLLVPVERSVLATMTGELIKPVKFDYITGKVENVKMDVTEPYWSINMKKAILGAFKMNLNRENEITSSPDAMFTKVVPDWERWMTGKTTTVYRVMEAGISGICESAYNVMPDAMNPAMLRVTKVRNFDNCAMAPIYEQGLLSGLTFIPEPINIKDLVQKSSQAEYMLTGTHTGFVIESARIDSRYITTLMAQEDGNVVTGIIQMLTLKTTKRSAGDITPTGNMDVRPNGIVYEWPSITTGKSWNLDYEGHFGWADMVVDSNDKIAQIDAILTRIVSIIHPMVTMPAVVEIKRVVGLMKTLSVKQLTDLCTRYTGTDTRKREIVLDLLPTLITPKLMPALVHLITENKISTTRAILSYQLAALTVTPTFETLTLINPLNAAFIQHPSVTARPVLYNTIVMTSASIVRRFVTMARKHGATNSEIEGAVAKNLADAMTLYQKTTSRSTRIAMIKGVSNADGAAFLPLLEHTIMNKAEDVIVRRSAIAAAANLPCAFYTKVQKILLPVYMDMTDDREVREVAFVGLIDTIPGPSVLNMIVHTQRKEKSVSVANLVYTYLCNVARMTLPGLETLARDVRRILPLVRAVSAPTEYSWYGSQNYYFDTNCANKEMCIAMNMFKSASTVDLHPSAVHARVYLHYLGKTIRAVEGSVWASGVTNVLNRLFGVYSDIGGPLTGKSIPEMIETILTPMKNFPVNLGTVADEINTIIEKLGILERPHADNLHLGFVLKLFGNDITFIDISEETIRDCIRTGNVPIIGNIRSLMTELQTTGLTFDLPTILHLGTSSIQVPTAAGVPFFVNMTGMAVTHFTGSVTPHSIGVMDAINYGMSGATPTAMGFTSDIKSSMAVDVTIMMGVDFSVMAIGTKCRSTAAMALPTILKTAINFATQKFTFTVTPPSVATEIGSHDRYGAVFMYTIPAGMTTVPTYKEIDIWHPAKFEMVNIKYQYTLPYTGIAMESSFHLPVALPSWMPFIWMWARYQAALTLTGSEPWQVTMQAGITTPSDAAPSWNTFTADPVITTPTVLHTCFTVGVESLPETNRARLDFNWAVGQGGWTHHIHSTAMLPGIMTNPLEVDVVGNPRILAVFGQPAVLPQSSTPNLLVMTVIMGERKVITKITPEDANAVNVAPFVNFAFTTLMKSLLGNGATITKERMARTETPIVLKMVTETTNIDANTMEWFGTGVYAALYTLLEAPGIPHIDINPVGVPTTVGQAHFVIYPYLQKIICVARLPNRPEYVIDVPWFWMDRPAGKLLSVEAPLIVPSQPTATRPALDRPTHRIPRTCSLSPVTGINADSMMTFDGAEFKVPALNTACEVLLARDCSHTGLFTVLASGVGNTKTVKVFVHNHMVEVSPVRSWMYSTGVSVKVDGRAMDITAISPAMLTVNGKNWGKVTKEAEWINIIIWNIGLIVSTDTRNVLVKAGPFYKGYLCGMCGNSNYEMMDDFMGPDMMTYPTAANMILKYVVPSATCPIANVRRILGVPDVSPTTTCTPVRRTGVVPYQGKTCFTMQPIHVCPAHCNAVGPMTKVITAIYCRNPNNVNTQTMVEDSKVGILDFTGVTSYTTIQVDEPRACVTRF